MRLLFYAVLAVAICAAAGIVLGPVASMTVLGARP